MVRLFVFLRNKKLGNKNCRGFNLTAIKTKFLLFFFGMGKLTPKNGASLSGTDIIYSTWICWRRWFAFLPWWITTKPTFEEQVILTVVPSILSKSKWYGWWMKFCTSWYGKYPIVYKVLYIPGGCLEFLPTTVAPCKCFEDKYVSCCLPVLFVCRFFFLYTPEI